MKNNMKNNRPRPVLSPVEGPEELLPEDLPEDQPETTGEDKCRITYQIQESRSAKAHQAVCAELLITAFGDSSEEARESLRVQVAQYLEDCDALGILDEVLIEAGFYFDDEAWISNEVAPVKDPNIVIFETGGPLEQ